MKLRTWRFSHGSYKIQWFGTDYSSEKLIEVYHCTLRRSKSSAFLTSETTLDAM